MSYSPRIYCVCPPGYRSVLRAHYSRTGVAISFRDRPEPARAAPRDPFGLAEWVAKLRNKNDASLLVVAPRRRSPGRSLPGPAVAGVPAGVVFSNSPSDLDPWLSTVSSLCSASEAPRGGVLAEWDDDYLAPATRLWRSLRVGPFPVHRWFANRLNRADLLERLRRGPRLVCYFGHGFPQGLAGYHGLDAHHFDALDRCHPVGTLCAWACDTVNDRTGPSFGRQLVSSGRVGSFLGSLAAVKTPDNRALVAHAGTVFSQSRPTCLAEWVGLIDRTLESQSPARRAWQTYRVLGDPLASFMAL